MEKVLIIGEKEKDFEKIKDLISKILVNTDFEIKKIKNFQDYQKIEEEILNSNYVFFNTLFDKNLEKISLTTKEEKKISNSLMNKLVFGSVVNSKNFLSKNSFRVLPFLEFKDGENFLDIWKNFPQPSVLKNFKKNKLFEIEKPEDLKGVEKILNSEDKKDFFLEEKVEGNIFSYLIYKDIFGETNIIPKEKLNDLSQEDRDKVYEEILDIFKTFKINSYMEISFLFNKKRGFFIDKINV